MSVNLSRATHYPALSKVVEEKIRDWPNMKDSDVASAIFGGSPGVAVFAHIGGFVAGLLLVRILGRRSGWRARRVSW